MVLTRTAVMLHCVKKTDSSSYHRDYSTLSVRWKRSNEINTMKDLVASKAPVHPVLTAWLLHQGRALPDPYLVRVSVQSHCLQERRQISLKSFAEQASMGSSQDDLIFRFFRRQMAGLGYEAIRLEV